VQVTAAGRAVAAEAQISLSAAARAIEVGQGVAAGRTGNLRIGCDESLIPWLLFPQIRRWRRMRPDVVLDVVDGNDGAHLLRGLFQSEFDLVVASFEPGTAPNAVQLGSEQMFVVAPDGHRFRQQASVMPGELASEPFIHYQPGTAAAHMVDSITSSHSLSLGTVIRTRSPRSAIAFALGGLGVTIAPASALASSSPSVFRPLDPAMSRPISVATTRPADALVARFFAEVVRRGLPDLARSTYRPLAETWHEEEPTSQVAAVSLPA
jgi:DNA-binding transcriptional LysR family regulator